jgi:hypothetical protein
MYFRLKTLLVVHLTVTVVMHLTLVILLYRMIGLLGVVLTFLPS